MIRSAPTLETERLTLRGWRKDDFRPWLAVMQMPEVNRFLGGMGATAEDLWRRLSAAAGSWTLLGFGGWGVCRRDDGTLVGNVGLFNAWRDLDPQFGEAPEMGWIFAPAAHGRGFAGEACTAVLGWAEANLEPTPIWAIIAPENAASMKLAAKLGFEPLHTTEYHGAPTVVLRRPAWA
ncbi:MAG TPA: GNAT family N-acetyltransferase [Sphingomicrobium sp.]|nr:GNAT family N-acetyltransferase [Sphingomicrobium sp.]